METNSIPNSFCRDLLKRIHAYYRDPEHRKEFEAWHLKKYGCPYEWKKGTPQDGEKNTVRSGTQNAAADTPQQTW
ncbi:MAG: hypothetical protein ACLTTQ_01975 [Christensenellales bacterium]